MLSIAESDYFCADLSIINENILFEIGFALGSKKPLFLVNGAKNEEVLSLFRQIGFLSSIEVMKYNDIGELTDKFYDSQIYQSDTNTFDSFLELTRKRNKKPLLFVKNTVTNNENSFITNELRRLKIDYFLSDGLEDGKESLSWFIESFISVSSIIIQFSNPSDKRATIHNLRCALLSGLAKGLNISNLLIIAPLEYQPAVNLREFTEIYNQANNYTSAFSSFAEEVVKKENSRSKNIKKQINENKRRSELQGISFGEIFAENEKSEIYDYYVVPAFANDLKRKKHNMIIGRKGCGKTATLYYLIENLREEAINHVCVIKPDSFQLDRLISLVERSKENFVEGFVIQSMWKFLIYTELAKSIYEKLQNKALYALQPAERSYMKYIEEHSNIFLREFPIRLENEIDRLTTLKVFQGEVVKDKELVKISESIHNSTIQTLRGKFIDIFNKRNQIYLLIDNLDKSWDNKNDLNLLSKYILGLLEVSKNIVSDLSLVKSRNSGINFSLTLFLRTDIFGFIKKNASEQDKLEYTLLDWGDEDLLFKIIEERFSELSSQDYNPEDLWSKFIEETNHDTKKFTLQKTFPRPRDIIQFFNFAREKAVERRHLKITKDDFESAYINYSDWVFETILVESDFVYKNIEDFFYALSGHPTSLVNRDDIVYALEMAEFIQYNIPDFVDEFIEYLFSLSFLGKEVNENDFRYDYGYANTKKIKMMSKKYAGSRYKIHPAFHPTLEIDMYANSNL